MRRIPWMTRVLLVEDNPFDMMMVKELIRETGVAAEVVEVSDGRKAMDILEKVYLGKLRSFDLVLLDINLPRRSGFEVLERLKERAGRPYVAIFSGSCSLEDRERAALGGADAYLVKPIGSSEVDAIISRLREIFKDLREALLLPSM
jgi:chemotaxis family two-component system response regulator Rcp1